jgi:signal transduction histidine kinase
MLVSLRRRLAGIRAGTRPLDVLAALLIFAVGEEEVVSGLVTYPGPPILAATMVAGSTLPIMLRRSAPLLMLAIMAATVVPFLIRFGSVNSFGPMLAMLGATYSVAQIADRRTAAAGAAILGLMLAVWGLGSVRPYGPGDWLFVAILFGGTLLVGRALGTQARRADVMANEAERLRRDRETAIQGAVDEERARIARELHDVVAHNVGLIVLQAGGGRSVLATEPTRARDALLAIESTGRQTLLEMRRLVGMLRGVEDQGERDPLPGLSRLGVLVDEVRATGLEVEVRTDGDSRALDPGVDLAAYRIVQEALTNVRRHAAASRVEVELRFDSQTLGLRIADDGRGPAGPDHNGVGHGLIGMRERALVYGGTFTAGARPTGGFEVLATLRTAVD